jgi:hypothetical protein
MSQERILVDLGNNTIRLGESKDIVHLLGDCAVNIELHEQNPTKKIIRITTNYGDGQGLKRDSQAKERYVQLRLKQSPFIKERVDLILDVWANLRTALQDNRTGINVAIRDKGRTWAIEYDTRLYSEHFLL